MHVLGVTTDGGEAGTQLLRVGDHASVLPSDGTARQVLWVQSCVGERRGRRGGYLWCPGGRE